MNLKEDLNLRLKDLQNRNLQRITSNAKKPDIKRGARSGMEKRRFETLSAFLNFNRDYRDWKNAGFPSKSASKWFTFRWFLPPNRKEGHGLLCTRLKVYGSFLSDLECGWCVAQKTSFNPHFCVSGWFF
ncbi:hypothetical protein [Sedimentisphaera salicampi]|uniref:hypothetical protein n=1 Tax=Sedimentisphaera salicampi TaxID=1941349 RepID=UPI000B9A2F8F|nr:hypothetical protein [Sedimentisphaera salicampi]